MKDKKYGELHSLGGGNWELPDIGTIERVNSRKYIVHYGRSKKECKTASEAQKWLLIFGKATKNNVEHLEYMVRQGLARVVAVGGQPV